MFNLISKLLGRAKSFLGLFVEDYASAVLQAREDIVKIHCFCASLLDIFHIFEYQRRVLTPKSFLQ
jgi:hypothetical protein